MKVYSDHVTTKEEHEEIKRELQRLKRSHDIVEFVVYLVVLYVGFVLLYCFSSLSLPH